MLTSRDMVISVFNNNEALGLRREIEKVIIRLKIQSMKTFLREFPILNELRYELEKSTEDHDRS